MSQYNQSSKTSQLRVETHNDKTSQFSLENQSHQASQIC